MKNQERFETILTKYLRTISWEFLKGFKSEKVELGGAYRCSTGDLYSFYALFSNYADLFCQVQSSNTSGSSSNNSSIHYSDNFGHLCQRLILPQGLLYIW